MKFNKNIIRELNEFSDQLKFTRIKDRIHICDIQMNARLSLPDDVDFDYEYRDRFIDLDFDHYSISVYKTHFTIHINQK